MTKGNTLRVPHRVDPAAAILREAERTTRKASRSSERARSAIRAAQQESVNVQRVVTTFAGAQAAIAAAAEEILAIQRDIDEKERQLVEMRLLQEAEEAAEEAAKLEKIRAIQNAIF